MNATESVCERERWSAWSEREGASVCVRERDREREREREGGRESESDRERERGPENPQFALIGLSSGGDPAACSRRIAQLAVF